MHEYYDTAPPICIIVTLLSSNSPNTSCTRVFTSVAPCKGAPTDRATWHTFAIDTFRAAYSAFEDDRRTFRYLQERERYLKAALLRLDSAGTYFFFLFFFFLQNHVLYFIQFVLL